MGKTTPHQCNCNVVHNCLVMTHPDPKVQLALSNLSTEIARYDDETNSRSRLELSSVRQDGGTFVSITDNLD